jgi:CRISPR-associated protein Cmr1
MRQMNFTAKTLTPIWTGGADAGKVDRIHETGIIGSLRWWLEVFVRGIGGTVTDPTQDERSGFDKKNFDKSNVPDKRQKLRDAGLCDVSQIFGATGWRRRFRLEIKGAPSPDNSVSSEVKADRKGKARPPTWYFPNKPLSGQFEVEMRSQTGDFQVEVLGGLFQFIADWVAVGARPQMGFGVIQLANRIDTRPLYDWLMKTAGTRSYPALPSLKNIFLASIEPKGQGPSFTEQTTFNLKYDLRRLFSTNQTLRHFIMGTVKPERMAAKVRMSRPFGKQMRVWGWIPEIANEYSHGTNRDAVVNQIYNHLAGNYNVKIWREMNSPRDTMFKNVSEARLFAQSLLRLEGGSHVA